MNKTEIKKISIYTRSGKVCPSSYYRILQYSKDFKYKAKERAVVPDYLFQKHNDVNGRVNKLLWYSLYYLAIYLRLIYFFICDMVIKPDYIIVLRACAPKIIPFPLPFFLNAVLKKPKLIWDFDDDIFEAKEITKREEILLIQYSSSIIVTNNYLKDLLPQQCKEKVILLPTTDGDLCLNNLEEVMQQRRISFEHEFKLLWVATSYSMKNLLHIGTSLEDAAKEVYEKTGKKLVLTVVCNKPLNIKTTYLEINNINWTRQIALDEILKSHIGIMPLLHNRFSLGKGGFKIVQYMAGGLPAIASKVGFNKEIIIEHTTGILIEDEESQDMWIESIVALSNDWDGLEIMGKNSFNLWHEKFSYNYNLRYWKSVLEN